MQSKTGLILPGLFRGNDFQERFLQSVEPPLFQAEREIEGFVDNLRKAVSVSEKEKKPDYSPTLTLNTDAVWLDWLFYALGAEKYLREDYDNEKKRNILQHLIELYRTKGTVEGLRLHWELLGDMKLLSYSQPPDKSFTSPSISETDRQLWEQKHPVLRLYPFAERGVKGRAMFSSDCIGWGYPSITDAGMRLADRVELYDPLTNVKTLLNSFYIDAEYALKRQQNIFEVRLKGKAYGIFPQSVSVSALPRHLINHEAGKRLYTLQLYAEGRETIQRRRQLSIKPSLTPMRGYYETEYIKGQRAGINLTNRYKDEYKDKGGSYLKGAFFTISTARHRIIKKMRLYDPARVSFFERQSFNYLNSMKVGSLNRHHAEAYVDMVSKAPSRASYLARHIKEHLCTSDAEERVQKMLWAGNLTRQAGCKIAVSITNRRPVTASMGTLCGRHKTGQYLLKTV